MDALRKFAEMQFEMRFGDRMLVSWIVAQARDGLTVEQIAGRLSELTGASIPAGAIRRWLRDG